MKTKRVLDAKITRRSLLVKGAALVASVAALPALIRSRDAAAATKVPKAAMQYQDKPKGTQDCSSCIQFIPGASATANGTCKVVEGAISPKGWCVAYVAKK